MIHPQSDFVPQGEDGAMSCDCFSGLPFGRMVFALTEGLPIRSVNPAMAQLLGYPDEASLLQSCGGMADGLFDPRDVPQLLSQALCPNGQEPLSLICRMRHREGRPLWLEQTSSRMAAADGSQLLCAYYTDLTRQRQLETQLAEARARMKQTEQALHETSAMYHMVTECTDINVWQYDIATDTLYQSENSQRIHGCASKTVEHFTTYALRMGGVRADCVDSFLSMYRQLRQGVPSITADIWSRSVGSDTWWCERITYVTLFDDAGTPVRALGIGRNITEEIRAQGEKQSIEIALANTRLVIWEYDVVNRIAIPRANFQRYFSTAGEMRDLPQSVIQQGLIHPDSAADFVKLHEQVAQGDAHPQATVRMRTVTGAYTWFRLVFHTLYDDQGAPIRAIGSAEDLTEIKQLEEHLNEELRYLNAIESEDLLAKGWANLSANRIESYVVKGAAALPCRHAERYDTLTQALIQSVSAEDQRRQLQEMMDRQTLLANKDGQSTHTVKYQRTMADGSSQWAKTTVKLVRQPVSEEILCFVYTYNIHQETVMRSILDHVISLGYDYVGYLDVPHDNYIIFTRSDEHAPLPPFYTTGYESEVAEYARQWVVPEDIERNIAEMSYANLFRQLETQPVYTTYVDVHNPDGCIAHKKLQFSYMDREKQLIIITRTDVTEIISREQKQKEMLRNALVQAERASVAKTNFLSRMSHEIRTPLNAIIGMSALAAQFVRDPEQAGDCIAKIGISARFLLSLINDILDMSRIESGKVTIKEEKIPFEAFLSGINTICHEQAALKGVDYENILCSDIDEQYLGDGMKLQQVLINVIGNAIKFTPAGGSVRFLVRQEQTSPDKALFHFTVKDTGIGIKADFLPHLFDAFEQGDATITSAYGGTGLGLAICKNLVSLMNGKIRVNSVEGVGSEFIIQLALGLCGEAKSRSSQRQRVNLRQLHALIVDDEVIICQHTKSILDSMGITANWVTGGTQAIETVQRRHDRHQDYDLILIDWKMPEMDGIAATRAIRRIVGPDVTIIIMTAYDCTVIEQEARKAGVNQLIPKPLFASSLAGTLETLFDHKTPTSPRQEQFYDFTGKRVLLVEDHALNIEVAMRLLSSRGLQVDVAENGLSAVEQFVQHGPGYYNAILMDIRMPVMDGLTAAKSIRITPQADARDVPIIAMSANAFEEDVEKSRAAGMNAHLAKPIEPEQLFHTLAKWM